MAQTILTDGAMSFDGGASSMKTTTLHSQLNPNGLARNELSWMDNATVRQGGISPRPAWLLRGTFPFPVQLVGAQYMGSEFYDPDSGDPYLLTVLDGHVWKLDVNNPAAGTDLSAIFGYALPITERAFFCQAEEFMVIQNGDGVTNPLFWDGARLWQSKGITNPAATPASGPHVNEIPAATAMCYYQGRIWYAQGRTLSAGDIVLGAAAYPAPGPPFYNGRDAVLCVQENPLCAGGDGFAVPTTAGNIRGIAYSGNINSQLGEGPLYFGTRTQIFQLSVPITRTDWIAANTNNMPTVTVALVNNGWVSDRSIVEVNGDLFFQSLEPSIRSLTAAIRNFQQWGNVPISTEEYRALKFNDRALMRFSSGVNFDNRLLMAILPYRCPVGVAHKAIAPLNFDVISTLKTQLPPAWEGMWEGLNHLELVEYDFGGLQRAFSIAWSDQTQKIELWELTTAEKFDKGQNRITYYFETPAFTFGRELELKRLASADIWIDNLFGEAVFTVQYRPDSSQCWYPWCSFKVCTTGGPEYPLNQFGQSYRQTLSLPTPPRDCAVPMGRPAYEGYQFQARVFVHGYCRVRGFFLHAFPLDRKLYDHLVCAEEPASTGLIGQQAQPFPPETPGSPCTITSNNPLAGGTTGAAYSEQVTASGGSGSLTFSITAGLLPDGLTISANGLITGTPLVANTFLFTVTATDTNGLNCSKELSITISAAAVGFMICNWATVLAALAIPPVVYDALCGASVLPAWDGVFNQTILKTTLEPVWYFTGQSIGAIKFGADESPTYPAAGWQDADKFSRLEWIGVGWQLRITCAFGLSLWVGSSAGGGIGDPSGTYTRIAGDSATPATIDVVASAHPELCPP